MLFLLSVCIFMLSLQVIDGFIKRGDALLSLRVQTMDKGYTL